ncbi:MAG TPA: DUF4492 domain-containing protein [Bacteroidales bacterium]|nr:DUF4492 domain-containing protein [Bacteroidales bacterium]
MMVNNPIRKVINFYLEGFRNLPDWGVKVWVVIIFKLFIMFFILKLFFFPDLLKRDFGSDSERSKYMLEQLTTKTEKYD